MTSTDADAYTNDPFVEWQWARRCFEHAETYFKLLCSISDPSTLSLTAIDDIIFNAFNKQFPDIKLDVISEDRLKSDESKAEWRKFCKLFEGQVEDYNFGTLIRLDASKAYDKENTCIVPKVQFLALEIARNRNGINKPEELRKLIV